VPARLETQNTTRDVAGMVVTALAQYKPKTLGKKNLVHDIVATLLHVMAVCQVRLQYTENAWIGRERLSFCSCPFWAGQRGGRAAEQLLPRRGGGGRRRGPGL
jgi:hypothetical protein